MPRSFQQLHPRQEVISERLILVEGMDEYRLFSRGLQTWGFEKVQIIDAGGKDQFPNVLPSILDSADVNGIDLISIGVVRDADENAEAAFTSIQNTLRSNGLSFPEGPRVLTSTAERPSTGILILPDDRNPGALENVCLESIQNSPAFVCIEQYLVCLKENDALDSNNEGKTAVHAYLASKSNPTTAVGLGAEQGYWDLSHSAFDVIREFVGLVDNSG